MKRKVSLSLAVLLIVAAFSGCQGKQAAAPAPAPADAAKTEAPAAEAPAAETKVDYPKGDVTFIIPNGAGGGNDLTTRALIPSLQTALGGINIIPTNKGESKGAIAANDVMTSKPDGQTLYFNSQTLILMPYGGMPDVKIEEFQPVAQVVEDTGVVYVKADSGYATVEDFVTAAKANKLKVGHNGVGALWHLAALQFSKAAGTEFQYVAYTQGGTQMLTALASGEIDMCIVNPSEAKAMVDAAKVRPVAVMSEERLEVFKDTPTLKESGIDVTFPVWRGVFTKKGVSEEILNELDRAFAAAVESKDFVDYCSTGGLPIKFRGHKEFTEFFNSEVIVYEELMKSVN